MPLVSEIGPIARAFGNILAGRAPESRGAHRRPHARPHAVRAPVAHAGRGRRSRAHHGGRRGGDRPPAQGRQPRRPAAAPPRRRGAGRRQAEPRSSTPRCSSRRTSELTIPVSCVEQGRWGYRGRHFAPGDASLFASVRQKKAAWVTRSVRAGRGHLSDQGAVWDELASKAAEHRVASPTGAMRDFYQRYEQEMAEARRELAPVPGQVGSLVYLSGRWVGMDLLAGAEPLRPRLAAPLRRVRGGCHRQEARRSPHAEPERGAPPALALSRRGGAARRARDRISPHRAEDRWRRPHRGRSSRPPDGLPGRDRPVGISALRPQCY